jgi:hypothetical protein
MGKPWKENVVNHFRTGMTIGSRVRISTLAGIFRDLGFPARFIKWQSRENFNDCIEPRYLQSDNTKKFTRIQIA